MQGGIGAHCRELARALTQAGHEVLIYTDARGQSDDTRVRLTADHTGWGWSSGRAVEAWVRRERIEVVNLHYQTAMYGMSPWVHFMPDQVKSAPVVTTFHDLRFPYLFPKAGPLRPWIVNRLARASAAAVSTNHEDVQALTHICPRVPVSLIPIGSSVHTTLPDDFSRAGWREAHGLSDAHFVVAHFGFMNHSKGIECLLYAVAELRRAGLPVRLWMIGGRTGTSDPTNAAFAQHIEHLMESMGLSAVVDWTGFVDDATASAYLTAADVVALPFLDGASYRRSSLMAAIAHGCAIVTTTPTVSIPTFVDGENLRLVEAGDVPGLVKALSALAADAGLRARLSAGALELCRWFDWGYIAQANVDCFKQALARWKR